MNKKELKTYIEHMIAYCERKLVFENKKNDELKGVSCTQHAGWSLVYWDGMLSALEHILYKIKEEVE